MSLLTTSRSLTIQCLWIIAFAMPGLLLMMQHVKSAEQPLSSNADNNHKANTITLEPVSILMVTWNLNDNKPRRHEDGNAAVGQSSTPPPLGRPLTSPIESKTEIDSSQTMRPPSLLRALTTNSPAAGVAVRELNQNDIERTLLYGFIGNHNDAAKHEVEGAGAAGIAAEKTEMALPNQIEDTSKHPDVVAVSFQEMHTTVTPEDAINVVQKAVKNVFPGTDYTVDNMKFSGYVDSYENRE